MITTEQCKQQYEEKLFALEKFAKSIVTQFNEIFENEKIELGFPLQMRVKKWSSIFEKIDSKRFNVKKSVLELQDLIGLRIILLSLSDLNKIDEILRKDFDFVKSYNPAEKLNFDQFGYSSLHYVLRIPNSWKSVPSFKVTEDFQFEIQVRTLSQHIWAETSSAFEYKTEQNIPRSLLRSVGRISALLETVDFEIDRLIIARKDYKKELENAAVSFNDENLNVDLLESLLVKNLGDRRFSENLHYDLILNELKSNSFNTQRDLLDLIYKYKIELRNSELEYIQKNRLYKSETAKVIFERGYYFDYLGAIRFMLRKEIVGYKLISSI
jgi:ppGpp synthetase/RelA/SpoT-type nucleotidyltranferase